MSKAKIDLLIAQLSVFSVLVATGGCTPTIYKEFSVDQDPPSSVSIDAKQRLILTTNLGGPEGDRRVTCAEPAPDVFTALAASGRGKFGYADASAEASAKISESAAKLGPRSQTIQLLRDGLYRACEAYMNGVIDHREYKRILLGYDETMLTLLAVEALAGNYHDLPEQLGPNIGNGEGGSKDQGKVNESNGQARKIEGGVIADVIRQFFTFQLIVKDKIEGARIFNEINDVSGGSK